jgi:hypothetical protein
MATHLEDPIDLREQIARIDQMRASTEKALIDIQKTRVDIDKVLADTRVVSFATIFQGLIAVAALIGAGAVIAKLLFT